MDLTTTYLGLELEHPVVASAGPLTSTVDGVKGLAEGGAAAVVLYSLFEEQLRTEAAREIRLIEAHEESFPEALDYFPSMPVATRSAAFQYLSLVERAVGSVDIPVIASLNGSDIGGWVDFARQLADAGAAALELNVYFVPGDIRMTGVEVVERHLDIVQAVRSAVGLPIAVKLSPTFSSPGHVALQILDAGADGLVLFNRFLLPDIDIETLTSTTGFQLSTAHEGRLPRTWIAALRNHTSASLAGSTGVETSDDVVRYLLSGADIVMTTASLIRNGRDYCHELVAGLKQWMIRKGFSSVDEVRGLMAVPADVDANAYERSGYRAAIAEAKYRYGASV